MELVSAKVAKTTSDSDYSQALWLHYLEGNPVDSFQQHLEFLKREASKYEVVKQKLEQLSSHPPSPVIIEFISNFSEYEQSIMYMLMLGLTLQQITEYKAVSMVRLQHIISTIGSSKNWENYGVKDLP